MSRGFLKAEKASPDLPFDLFVENRGKKRNPKFADSDLRLAYRGFCSGDHQLAPIAASFCLALFLMKA
jgi:hypothetical protein